MALAICRVAGATSSHLAMSSESSYLEGACAYTHLSMWSCVPGEVQNSAARLQTCPHRLLGVIGYEIHGCRVLGQGGGAVMGKLGQEETLMGMGEGGLMCCHVVEGVPKCFPSDSQSRLSSVPHNLHIPCCPGLLPAEDELGHQHVLLRHPRDCHRV